MENVDDGAGQTLAATANGVAGAPLAGIDYFVIEVRAERTFHARDSPGVRARISDIGFGAQKPVTLTDDQRTESGDQEAALLSMTKGK